MSRGVASDASPALGGQGENWSGRRADPTNPVWLVPRKRSEERAKPGLVWGRHVRRGLKYLLVLTGVALCLVISLFAWSFYADQQRFRAAKNACERGCIQDSGGLEECREICVHHPDRYP